jgi:hypothetical protein
VCTVVWKFLGMLSTRTWSALSVLRETVRCRVWIRVLRLRGRSLLHGVVDVQCSRVEVVEDDAEVEDPAARGGDDGDLPRLQHQVPLCILHSVDGPCR